MAYSIDLTKYTCDAVDAVQFKLIRDKDDLQDESNAFVPDMTHQIFGQEERIFGYRDLLISMYYTAGPMYINFSYKYSRKVNELPAAGVEKLIPDKIEEAIDNALPDISYFTNIDEFSKMIGRNKEFRPYGVKKLAFHTDKKGKMRCLNCISNMIDFILYYRPTQAIL